MIYKSKIYAKALIRVILDKKTDDKKIVHDFLKLLEKDGNLKNAKEIIALTQKYYLEKRGNKSIVLETARKVEAKGLIGPFIKVGDIVKEKISPEIIAGIRITVNDEKQIDNSLLVKLNKII